jgi:hypothetical protein
MDLERESPAALAGADRALGLLCSAASNSGVTVSGSDVQAARKAGGPSTEAIADVDEFLLDEIYRDLDLIKSYSISAMEAAHRGDRDELRLRLRGQLRDIFRHAVELHNLLSTERPRGGS